MKFPQRLRTLKPGKTWIVLGMSIGIGLLAALGARSYLSGRVAELEARARGQKVNVVVAVSDLRQGEKISNETVAVRSLPKEYVHASAIAPDQFERIDGQLLAFAVKGGEPVLWSMVEPRRPPTFSTRVEAGRRAITVPVDEINSISGLLEPGDLIDLMFTVDQKGKKITVPLMQGVHVMATGQRSVDDPRSGERRTYNTVTLDADPGQAQNIIVARDAGRITALLRNPQDKDAGKGGRADLAALLGAASLVGGPREVPVLYGGRSARLPPEGLTLGQYAPSVPLAPAPGSVAPSPSATTAAANAVNTQLPVAAPAAAPAPR